MFEVFRNTRAGQWCFFDASKPLGLCWQGQLSCPPHLGGLQTHEGGSTKSEPQLQSVACSAFPSASPFSARLGTSLAGWMIAAVKWNLHWSMPCYSPLMTWVMAVWSRALSVNKTIWQFWQYLFESLPFLQKKKKKKKKSNSIFPSHWGNIDVFMAANKRNAEQEKTNAEFHTGFGVARELRHWTTLQGIKGMWGLHMQWSRGLELCNPD